MPKQPLAEIFGFPITNQLPEAIRYRENQLCPYNNKVPNCTKDKANDPLGVCSILTNGGTAITCPVRFRQEWIIAADAAKFFFPEGAKWTSLTEVRLKDSEGESAGNIDVVLVAYDDKGRLTDFGALEVQAVYISGNVRNPFEAFVANPIPAFDWSREKNYPGPDYLSSSRKRLAPQLLFKGGILHAWKKKSAVALDKGFFDTLPNLDEVPPEKAEIAWMIYDLIRDKTTDRFVLTRLKTVYTTFNESLREITVSKPGKVDDFVKVLQGKLDEKLEGTPPSNVALEELL